MKCISAYVHTTDCRKGVGLAVMQSSAADSFSSGSHFDFNLSLKIRGCAQGDMVLDRTGDDLNQLCEVSERTRLGAPDIDDAHNLAWTSMAMVNARSQSRLL